MRLSSWRSKEKTVLKENEQCFGYLWEKHSNVRTTGIPEQKKKEKRKERIFKEIMAKTSPKLMNDMNLHIQEAQRIPRSINSKISLRHVFQTIEAKSKHNSEYSKERSDSS